MSDFPIMNLDEETINYERVMNALNEHDPGETLRIGEKAASDLRQLRLKDMVPANDLADWYRVWSSIGLVVGEMMAEQGLPVPPLTCVRDTNIVDLRSYQRRVPDEVA